MADLPNLNLVSTPTISPTAILRSAAVVADPRIEAQSRFDQFAVGKSFQAIVTSMMQDGKATVQFIATPPQTQGPQVQMQLPTSFKVGDKIDLKLAKPPPELTFQLASEQIPSTAESISLSSGAKLLTQILQSVETNDPQANHIQGSQALLPSKPVDAKQMATELPSHLHQAVQLSGVFYESHLKEWVNGSRTLDQVKQEPQNQVLKNTHEETTTNQAQTQLIPAQLNAQENRQLLWRGELIPGQAFEWQIKDDTPKQSSPNTPPEEKTWLTSVKFNLPQLGQVHAVIQLVGNNAGFRITTQNAQSANLLMQNKDQLNLSLSASGTEMTQFFIDKNGSSS